MLWFSAKFGQDPLAAFDAVKAMNYEPYRGSLRGTRGTLWSGGGNSLDQSSLLIAMLRAAGIPA
ncbi:transglutaminase family protein, partial [Arthrospira platensis SPKY2]